MKYFLNLKIRVKLILAFVIVAMIAVAVGLVGMSNINKIHDNGDIMYNNRRQRLSPPPIKDLLSA